MTVVVDTSVLIDYLRDHPPAIDLLEDERARGLIHANEVVRLELLSGMREHEEAATRSLLTALTWHPLTADIAEEAGQLGRRWLASHSGIDAADLAIAATTTLLGGRLLTRNARHFPMFAGLEPPY